MLPLRILLMSDVLDSARRLGASLEAQGFDVAVAGGSSSPAIAIMQNYPDLLILDPPAGPGRFEVVRRAISAFRSRHPLSVIVLAPHPMSEQTRRVLASMADLGLVPKPHRTAEILARIDEGFSSDEPALLAG